MIKFKGLNNTNIKIIAIISMFIDHFIATIFDAGIFQNYIDINNIKINGHIFTQDMINNIYIYGRMWIGRIAFPLFCFLIVQGFMHTRSKKKYAIRLFVFALISEIPFDLAFNNTFFTLKYQNVFFTLFLGLISLILIERFSNQLYLRIFCAIATAVLAECLNTDYGMFGVLLIQMLYFLRYNKFQQLVFGVFAYGAQKVYYQISAFVIMLFYNNERGKNLKYFFYIFYPAHLLLLHGLKVYIAHNPINIF